MTAQGLAAQRLASGILRSIRVASLIGALVAGPAQAQVAPNPPPVVTPTAPTPVPRLPRRAPTGAVSGSTGGGRSGLAVGLGVGAAAIGLGLAAGAMRSQPAFGVPADATLIETRPRASEETDEPPPRRKPRKARIERVSRTPERDNAEIIRDSRSPSPRPDVAQPSVARAGFVVPTANEKRYVPGEVLIVLKGEVAPARLRALETSLRLTPRASARITLLDAEVRRYALPRGTSVAAAVRALRKRSFVAGAQPNYLFELQQGKVEVPAPPTTPAVQYAIDALRLKQAHKIANGSDIRIAIIDSGVDETNPELKDSIADRFDAVGGAFKPHAHGTAIGGAIVAHKALTGTAPNAKLIAVRAFTGAAAANGTGFDVLRGLDYAVAHGARIVNMSFAGPQDALLKSALDAARKRGVVTIAAAGNGGPLAKPLFPAAEPGVIAVTATDADGKPFAKANRGPYVAVAAPGVDVVAPGLGDSVQITSGTSIATAEASGVAALLLQRRPGATPEDIRRILGSTAVRLPSEPSAGGAGLIDAEKAVQAAK